MILVLLSQKALLNPCWILLTFLFIFCEVDNKNGALTKKWIDQPDDTCGKCREDKFCSQTITVNIDLQNVTLQYNIISEEYTISISLDNLWEIKCLWWTNFQWRNKSKNGWCSNRISKCLWVSPIHTLKRKYQYTYPSHWTCCW